MDSNSAIKWFTDNGMQANFEKVKFMMISRDEVEVSFWTIVQLLFRMTM